jgi:hypothetical protein
MARQSGIIRIKGKLGDISFYSQNGEDLTRIANGPSKQAIEKSPNFKRTRENNTEFGGSAIVGKAFKDGFQLAISKIKDSKLHARLVKVFREINKRGSGTRGQRPFTIVANKDLLVGFEFDGRLSLDGIMLAPYSLSVNAGRTQVTASVPDFNTDDLINAPQGATHFRFINAISVLSNYGYQNSTKKYEPVDTTLNKLNATVYSSYLPIAGMVGAATTLIASLTGSPTMNTNVGLISCFGIEFYQQVNGTFYLLSAENALRVANIF